jgi:CubicO group peptidase (beta-lactamase class C family)
VIARARFREAVVRTTPELMQQHNVPQVDVAFVVDDAFREPAWESFSRVLHSQSSGAIERAWGEAPTRIYRVGSMTKPIVALAVLALARDGVVDIDEPLSRELSELETSGPKAWRDAVTLRHLMSHTAGLREVNPPRANMSSCELLSLHASWMQPPQLSWFAPPATCTQYSGMGYALLQWVIESKMRKHLHEVVREVLFEPLQAQAWFEVELASVLQRDDAQRAHLQRDSAEQSHQTREIVREHDEQGQAVDVLPSVCSASSGLVASPRAICMMLQRALFSSFLPDRLRSVALTPQPSDMDGALFTAGFRAHGEVGRVSASSLTHAGLRPGHASVVVVVPSRRAVACIATSARAGSKICKPLTGLFREINVAE